MESHEILAAIAFNFFSQYISKKKEFIFIFLLEYLYFCFYNCLYKFL